jgi:casein kinase 1
MLIEGKYVVMEELGKGTFGMVYLGKNIYTDEFVAIKCEAAGTLLNEARMYLFLKQVRGVPKMRTFGGNEFGSYIVMDLMDGELLSKPPTSLIDCGKTILRILEGIHDVGIIHRDIKPQNIMVRNNQLYLVDFGLARFYKNLQDKHIPMKTNQSMVGTKRYASENVRNGLTPSRRDDLESLAYVLLYMSSGCSSDAERVCLKAEHPKEADCPYTLAECPDTRADCPDTQAECPELLVNFLKYAKQLKYDERPDYRFFDKYQ